MPLQHIYPRKVDSYFVWCSSKMELPGVLPNDSNALITRQLQKDNCDVNFGEHEIVFMLEAGA